ncbi:WD40-repeat-containing domain protein [Neurospora crassa]|nr:WD40-repeat-containing domain protein [Neurospora crassa]
MEAHARATASMEEAQSPHAAESSTKTNRRRGHSLSVSPPWHTAKSTTHNHGPRDSTLQHSIFGQNHGPFRSHRQNSAASDDAVPAHPKQGHKLKGMLRRASVSFRSGVKGIVHRRTSVPNTPTFEPDAGAGPSQPSATARPTTAHSTWNKLRQATSFHRHSRRMSAHHGEYPFGHLALQSPPLPVPGSGEQPPIIPRNTGAAARQAAASAGHGLEMINIPAPRPWANDGMDDYESGIGIAVTRGRSSESDVFMDGVDSDVDIELNSPSPNDEVDIIKVDFISQLPLELGIHILGQLDASSLASASLVSRSWNHAARNQHIWRESFLREKTTTYATSGAVKPGTGLGVPAIRPGNDWKEIYRVREELDKRWKEGKARPIYLHGHTDSIYCLQFDEHKIITGSRDKTIRVWDMKTYSCKLVLGPPEIINDSDLSLLHDEAGNPIHYATLPELDPHPSASGQIQTPARSHFSSPALFSPPIFHRASILCLQYDDEILVTGSSDATCIVYDIASGYQPVRQLRHHSAAVLDLVFDDKHIVTCSKDVSICVWDRATGALLKQLRGHTGPVNAVQMRGNTIVSCSGDFRVKLWNIETGKQIREFLGHTKGLACSQFSEDGRYVASAGNDRVIRIWDANTGECVREMKAHGDLVRSLHVDSVSGRLVSGSYDTDIKVWDMETGAQLLDFPQWHNSWVLSAKSDYRRIVSSGQDPKILIMDFGADVKGIEMLETPASKLVPQHQQQTHNQVAVPSEQGPSGYL